MNAPASSVVVRAPAKVNLTLFVTGRRSDGYHTLDSVMVPIGLYDDLAVAAGPARRARTDVAVCGPEAVPADASNLAARAAEAVLERLDERARVRIRLYKRIPVGAGLGGGSSDAGAVIRVLPRLLGRRLGTADALALAESLGADVPFFVRPLPARVRGIGERIAPIAGVAATPLVVVVPAARVDTAWAYRNALGGLTSDKRLRSFRRLSWRDGRLQGALQNDFERGVARHVTDVGRLKRQLADAGADATVLSGSGSAVVGVFASMASARRAAAALRSPDVAYAVRILRSPPRPVGGRWPSW